MGEPTASKVEATHAGMSKVCVCANVTKGEIYQAVREGCTTFRQLVRQTGASTGCGCCGSDVRAVLHEALAEIKEGQRSLNF